MRSFLRLAILAGILWVPLAFAQTSINLFVIEKPVKGYQEAKLNSLLTDAMNDLLVRLTGGEEILQNDEVQKYLTNPQRWVKSYQFENIEDDGVVLGQKLVVTFDNTRLLSEFQQDDIYIWPLNNRPKTLMFGNFNQQGLITTISHESLQYRVDMDYQAYASLVGLEIDIPQKNIDYAGVGLASLIKEDELPAVLREDYKNYDYILVSLARQEASEVKVTNRVFSIATGQRVQSFTKQDEGYLNTMNASFAELLSNYSSSYRQGVDNLGITRLEVGGVNSFASYSSLDKFLQGLKPSIREVKLVQINGDKVTYELFYHGGYDYLINLLKTRSSLTVLDESRFTGTVFTQFNP